MAEPHIDEKGRYWGRTHEERPAINLRYAGHTITLDSLAAKGYTVEDTGETQMPYTLTGKRGAVYGLWRTLTGDGKPDYTVPMYITRSNGNMASFYGNGWVTD